MPHVSGITEKGFSNNWWDYLYTYDYVNAISNEAGKYSYVYNIGDKVNNIVASNKYQSGKVENDILTIYQPNMIFEDMSLFQVNDKGEIIASKVGSTEMKYFRDGKFATYKITVQ